MKGPLVTQTLQGIVGNGAMHWRGDKENVAAFAPAFVGLQGDDAEPGAADMQKLENFIASVRYPPNPNRNPDGSLPASMAVTGGNGNPASGLNLFQTFPSLPGGLACAACHALPNGTTGEIDNPGVAPQPMKNAQLRGLWEKVGMSFASQNNTRGFGFMSDSRLDTLMARLTGPFNFGPANLAPQRRRDVEAFLLAFETETPAAVGRMVTFDGSNNTDPTAIALLASLIAQADSGSIAMIARRYEAAGTRGHVYATQSVWLSDRENQPTTADALRTGASASAPVSFIAVPITTQFRVGVDRDADGVFDQDELDGSADPANAASLPAGFCRADFDGNGTLDAADLSAFTAAHIRRAIRAPTGTAPLAATACRLSLPRIWSPTRQRMPPGVRPVAMRFTRTASSELPCLGDQTRSVGRKVRKDKLARTQREMELSPDCPANDESGRWTPRRFRVTLATAIQAFPLRPLRSWRPLRFPLFQTLSRRNPVSVPPAHTAAPAPPAAADRS